MPPKDTEMRPRGYAAAPASPGLACSFRATRRARGARFVT